MEEFLKIDWTPSVDDVLDEVFVEDQRLLKDSAAYRIVHGTFTDPFADIHKELDIDIDALETDPELETAKKPNNKNKANKKANRIEGAPKIQVTFPKTSELTVKEQAICSRTLARSLGSEKQIFTDAMRADMQTYVQLSQEILKEQEQFLKFAKEQWTGNVKSLQEDYLNQRWKRKLREVGNLPRRYVEVESIPFVANHPIEIKSSVECLRLGKATSISFPSLKKHLFMMTNTGVLLQNLPPEKHEEPRSCICCTPEVSRDEQAERLADEQDVDLVISSGGLNCLANNISGNYSNSWILPVVVKEQNGRNVVYVDKPLPPTSKTTMQKNSWVFKYVLRSFFTQSKDRPQKECSERVAGASGKMQANACRQNLSYGVFELGYSGELPELLKTGNLKNYKILLRSRIDATAKSESGCEYPYIMLPKLEYQPEFGAGEVSLDEACKQWMSLTFRPGVHLMRVRISAHNCEVIQYEKKTALGVSQDIKRIHNVKPEESLSLLYNVCQSLTNLQPGRYLLRHTLRSGAFATLYKVAPEEVKNVLDLETVYAMKELYTVPDSSWPPIDKVLLTPYLERTGRVPATFPPNTKPSRSRRGFTNFGKNKA